MSMNRSGTSLVELLVATALAIAVAICLALLVPKVSSAITQNRQRLVAAHLIASQMEDLQDKPYGLLPMTAQSDFPSSNATCDCNKIEDMSSMPAGASTVEGNTVYTSHVCINYEQGQPGGIWSASCPPNPYPPSWSDPGMKNIRIRMTWNVHGTPHWMDLQSEVTPS